MDADRIDERTMLPAVVDERIATVALALSRAAREGDVEGARSLLGELAVGVAAVEQLLESA